MHAKQNTEPLLIFNFFFYRFHLHTLSDRKAKLKNTRQVSNSQFFFKLINKIRWWMSMPIHRKLKSVDWLIDYQLFCVPLETISFVWRRHHWLWRAAQIKAFAQRICSFEHRGILNSATSVVTRGPGVWRNHPKDRRIKSTESPEAPPH